MMCTYKDPKEKSSGSCEKNCKLRKGTDPGFAVFCGYGVDNKATCDSYAYYCEWKC